jgi:hypothetical protein
MTVATVDVERHLFGIVHKMGEPRFRSIFSIRYMRWVRADFEVYPFKSILEERGR